MQQKAAFGRLLCFWSGDFDLGQGFSDIIVFALKIFFPWKAWGWIKDVKAVLWCDKVLLSSGWVCDGNVDMMFGQNESAYLCQLLLLP